MGGEIVEDDVDLFASRLTRHDRAKKRDELGAGVAVNSLADDRSRFCVECGVERKRPVAVVLESVTHQPAWTQGKDRIEPIEGLDVSLLVYAEDCGMLGWIEIEPDHVGSLLLEVGIVRQHVALDAVRPDPGTSPGPMHKHMAHAKFLRQTATAPVSGSVIRFASRSFEDAGFHRRGKNRRPTPTMPGVQSGQPMSHKPLLPAGHERRAATKRLFDRSEGLAVCQHQNQARPSNVIRSSGTGANTHFEL